MRTSTTISILTLGLMAVLSIGCKQDAGSTPARPIPVVEVITATPQTVRDEPEFIGQAESSRPVEIRSQVTGIMKQRFFTEGRPVKKGDRLYQIDPVPFEAAVLSAKAKVSQAEARLVQAKQNLARVKPLLEEQAVSQKDVDDAVAEDLAARAALEAAKGELVRAKFDFDNTMITAPIDGIIERTRFYEGRLISAQTDLLTVIHQVDPMYVTVSVPENYLLRRRKELAGKRVERPDLYQLKGMITFSDGSTHPHEGILDFADVGLRTETGTRQGRFVFPNADQAILPGQFVKIRVVGYVRAGAILIPQRAVLQGPKGSFVYVVGEGDTVEVREVQASLWQGDLWLIEEGLKPGERVVVSGLLQIGPGAPVRPVPAGGAPPAPDTSSSPSQRQG